MNCSKCNMTLPVDSEFCQYCGDRLIVNKAEETIVEKIGLAKDDIPKMQREQEVNMLKGTVLKPEKIKKRFCKYCGGEIDNATKTCQQCGKKHFKIRKKSILIMCVFALLIGTVTFLVIYFSAGISQKNKEINELNTKIIQLNNQISTLQKEKSNLSSDLYGSFGLLGGERKTGALEKANFMDDHIVIVFEGVSYYHKYGCSKTPNGEYTFWAYNEEAAISKGYHACSLCN